MKVVVIEDSPEVAEMVSLSIQLRWPEATVLSVARGEQGLEVVERESPDLVLLDINLPDIDGFEVLRQLRLFSQVPVLILSVRGGEVDRVKGLELGADDYIPKPFSHIELLARIKAVLRRSHMPQLREGLGVLMAGELVIDRDAHQVTLHGKPIKLTPLEYGLLVQLVRYEGKVLSHEALLQRVWGEEFAGATEYVKKYISRLREKLGDDPASPKIILSERGVGYKLVRPG